MNALIGYGERGIMKKCHACGREWVSEVKRPAVKEVCEGCGAYLHCCLNCRYHDPHAHNQCYIPTTDWVGDRAGCNFCDEFEFADGEKNKKHDAAKDKARDALGKLFGENGEDPGTREGKDAFGKLFGGD